MLWLRPATTRVAVELMSRLLTLALALWPLVAVAACLAGLARVVDGDMLELADGQRRQLGSDALDLPWSRVRGPGRRWRGKRRSRPGWRCRSPEPRPRASCRRPSSPADRALPRCSPRRRRSRTPRPATSWARSVLLDRPHQLPGYIWTMMLPSPSSARCWAGAGSLHRSNRVIETGGDLIPTRFRRQRFPSATRRRLWLARTGSQWHGSGACRLLPRNRLSMESPDRIGSKINRSASGNPANWPFIGFAYQ